MKLDDQSKMGALYDRAMKVEDQDEADGYFDALVERNMRLSKLPREEAEAVERSNLGYWAGYYDWDTRKRIRRLYGASHPIFGDRQPTPEEAFQMGAALAQKVAEKAEKGE